MRRFAAILTMSLASLAAFGCAPPLLHVSRGEPFVTNNPMFDDFFIAVREVRAEGLAAKADEQASHEALIRALGLEPNTPSTQTLDEASVRAKKLQEKGVLLHLDIAPEPKLVITRGKPSGEGEALLKTMEDSARISLDMRKRFAVVAARAAELEKRRIALRAQASIVFRADPQIRRDEIIDELDGAKAVLADAGDSASTAASVAARFVIELVQAVETSGSSHAARRAAAAAAAAAVASPAPPPPPPPSKPTAFKPASGGPPAAAPPSSPAPPPSRPKPKPRGGDDFEP